jgi:hypothetical protein
MALISLISGILGLTLIPFIGSVVAVITGPMAKKEIQASNGSLSGDGLATAGIILGWIGIALGVLTACGVGLVFLVPFCALMFGITTDSLNSILPGLLAFLF